MEILIDLTTNTNKYYYQLSLSYITIYYQQTFQKLSTCLFSSVILPSSAYSRLLWYNKYN